MLVTMGEIIEYLGDGVRPLKEGLNLYKSQHVINIGQLNGRSDIHAQVIQTSNPKGPPHNVKISGLGTSSKSWIAVCSCKSGLGHKCKHVFATLLYIFHSKENLDILSSTDVTQLWGVSAREITVQPFDAKRFSELCCVADIKPARKMSADIRESNFKRMIDAAPDSAVALHFRRQRILTPVDPISEENTFNKCKYDRILDSIFNVPTGQYILKQFVLPGKGTVLMKFYHEKIHCNLAKVKLINCKTLGQMNNDWKLERRKRITSSDAYKLFTYMRNKAPNWQKKISDYVNPLNFQFLAMRYGSKTEKLAFSLYEERFHYEITRMGFIVSPVLPWLGCSVDGYIPSLRKIVEFKCPVLGATADIANVLPTLNYLDKDLRLKKKHMYFCQVQLAMAILNAKSCDFVVYCKHKQQIHVVPIQIDTVLANKYTRTLYPVFFNHILPTVQNFKNDNI